MADRLGSVIGTFFFSVVLYSRAHLLSRPDANSLSLRDGYRNARPLRTSATVQELRAAYVPEMIPRFLSLEPF